MTEIINFPTQSTTELPTVNIPAQEVTAPKTVNFRGQEVTLKYTLLSLQRLEAAGVSLQDPETTRSTFSCEVVLDTIGTYIDSATDSTLADFL